MNKTHKKKFRVLFVCTGNTCRSPMAENIFRQFLKGKDLPCSFVVQSAGLFAVEGQPMSQNAVDALAAMEIKAKKHSSCLITPQAVEKSGLIVCMTAEHKEYLMQECEKKYFTFAEITGGADVPDPYLQDLEKYKTVADYMLCACEDILRLALELIEAV